MPAEETVQKIVEGTIRCLIEKGYTQTTISDIAAASGVSRGALSHHFATKESLILEVLNRVLQDKADQFVRRLPQEATLALVDFALDEVFRAYTEQPVFMVYIDLWAQARWNPKLREVIREHFRVVRRIIARIVERDFAQLGPITDGDTIGLLLLTVVEGIALQYLTDPDTVDANRLLQSFKTAARLLFAGRPLAPAATPRTPPRQS
ncbi:MAG TPA: TetR/AcrR family transcriptional regulator [Polyangia bacterium]|nr:TetR/AcrR family transcriptional regulator [Polyangia bacterium]